MEFDSFVRELVLPKGTGFWQDLYVLFSLLYALVYLVAGTKQRVPGHFEHEILPSVFQVLGYSCQAIAFVMNPTANVASNEGLFTQYYSEWFSAVATSEFFASCAYLPSLNHDKEKPVVVKVSIDASIWRNQNWVQGII